MDAGPIELKSPLKPVESLISYRFGSNINLDEQVKKFYRQRRLMALGLLVLDIIAGATFGLSPFTNSLNTTFESRYIGVWVTAVLLCITSVMFLPCCKAMKHATPRMQKIMFLAIVPLYAGGSLLGAISVRTKQEWLLFLGWALPAGIAQGLENYVGKVLWVQWMGMTGHQALGAAYDGLIFAGSTALFTFINGNVITNIGLENTYYLWAGVWVIVGAPWIVIAAIGKATEPPKMREILESFGEDGREMQDASKFEKHLAKAMNNLKTKVPAKPGGGDQATPGAEPEPPLTTRQYLRSPRFWTITLVTFIIFFTGFTIQSLISIFFGVLFKLPLNEASNWSALSLAAIALIRFAVPFLSTWVPAMSTTIVTQLLQTVVYAVMPTALSHTSGVGVFIVLQILANAGFAISYSIISLLFIEFFGMENLSSALSLSFLFGASSAALIGPVVAAYTSDPTKGTAAYNTYWYIASGLSGFSTILLLSLKGTVTIVKRKSSKRALSNAAAAGGGPAATQQVDGAEGSSEMTSMPAEDRSAVEPT